MMKQIMKLFLIIFVSIAFLACQFPEGDTDMGTDRVYYGHVIPKLLGRKPLGVAELDALITLENTYGRQSVLESLMRTDEFRTLWREVLLDNYRVQRNSVVEGPSTNAACFRNPRLAAPDSALVTHIVTQPSTSTFAQDFNLVDVADSAILADDLSAFVLAAQIPVIRQLRSPSSSESGEFFTRSFMNRDVGCITCHNEYWSASDGNNWDRTWPVLFNVTEAALGSRDTNTIQVEAFDVFAGASTGGGNLWGMTSCGGTTSNAALGTSNMAGLTGASAGTFHLLQAFQNGRSGLLQDGLEVSFTQNDPYLTLDDSSEAYFYAFALALTNQIFHEMTGEELVVPHGLPRNSKQRDALYTLTGEALRSGSGYSLKAVLIEILLSDNFGRAAPADSAQNSPYTLPRIYDPWTEVSPANQSSPPEAIEIKNGQGEVVHRNTPWTLVQAVSYALDWPQPTRRIPISSQSSFPSFDMHRASGQYISEGDLGTQGVDFQRLLSWESQLGACEKPAGVATDYIDSLMTTVVATHNSQPVNTLDIATAMKNRLLGRGGIDSNSTPDLEGVSLPSEREAIGNLFGVADPSDPISIATSQERTNLQTKIREYCGVLVKSPRFLMTGVEPSDDGATSALGLSTLTCPSGACGHADFCHRYEGLIPAQSVIGPRRISPCGPVRMRILQPLPTRNILITPTEKRVLGQDNVNLKLAQTKPRETQITPKKLPKKSKLKELDPNIVLFKRKSSIVKKGDIEEAQKDKIKGAFEGLSRRDQQRLISNFNKNGALTSTEATPLDRQNQAKFTGPNFRGLDGGQPTSFEEAMRQANAYRNSQEFAASHPELRKSNPILDRIPNRLRVIPPQERLILQPREKPIIEEE